MNSTWIGALILSGLFSAGAGSQTVKGIDSAYIPGRRDARSCDATLVSPGTADVTDALNACVSSATREGKSIYIPQLYYVRYLRIPPGGAIWCDNLHHAGVKQIASGTGNAGDGDPNYATVAVLDDSSNIGIEIHDCLIDGNKSGIYSNPSNPGNTHPIAGFVSEHKKAFGGHPRDILAGSVVQFTTGDGVVVGPHNYDSAYMHDSVYAADQYGLNIAGVSDVSLDDWDVGQSMWGGVFVHDGSNIRLTNFKSWFGGQGLSIELVSVDTAKAGKVVYSGNFDVCATHHCVGNIFSFAGFRNAVNNGSFKIESVQCSGKRCSSATVSNENATAERAKGNAAVVDPNNHVVPGNFYLGLTAPHVGGGGWQLSNMQSQDALGAGFYFRGDPKLHLPGVYAVALFDDSANLALRNGEDGSCYDMKGLTYSFIQGGCGKWEQGTPGIPTHALKIYQSDHNTIFINSTGTSGYAYIGEPAAYSLNYININAAQNQFYTGLYNQTYVPNPQTHQLETVVLSGDILIKGTDPGYTFPGQMIELFLVEGRLGGGNIRFDPTYILPEKCSFRTAPDAMNYYKFVTLDGRKWWLMSSCPVQQ